MNPLRSLFVQLSRIPPAAMLLVIIGLAVMVTMMVTDVLHRQEQSYIDKEHDLQTKLDAKTTVVYAVKDIPEGQQIPSEALEEHRVDTARAPQDALPSSSLASGRVAKYGIAAGQIVSQHDLMPQGIQMGFESHLRDGMRAVTFAVDNNSGVAGFVTPESRVDIISMVGSGSDTKAAPVLSDVQVIAVGQSYQKAANGGGATPASSVTVEVSPEDTQKLIKAIAASKVYLALRNDKDHTPLATVDVTSLFGKPQSTHPTELVGMNPPPPLPPPNGELPDPNLGKIPGPDAIAQAPAPPLHEVEIWSAGKKDVAQFPSETFHGSR
jgi:pilus assembly protein CpaB